MMFDFTYMRGTFFICFTGENFVLFTTTLIKKKLYWNETYKKLPLVRLNANFEKNN